jgi:hypothetical protein
MCSRLLLMMDEASFDAYRASLAPIGVTAGVAPELVAALQASAKAIEELASVTGNPSHP